MLEDIKLSFKGILSHKMRSFLTMLGIIVGVAAVIAVVSTINGTNEQIKNNLIGDGSNTVVVELYQDGWAADFSYTTPPSGLTTISDADMESISKIDGVVKACTFHKRDYSDGMYYQSTSLDGTSLYGISDGYLETAGLEVIMGRGFSKEELTDFKKVALIDRDTYNSVFEGDDPIGKSIEIKGEPYKIIGVVDKSSTFEPVIKTVDDYETYNSDSSSCVYIPDTTWPLLYMYDEPESVLLKADSVDDMTSIGKKTAELLNTSFSLGEDSSVTYKSTNMADAASQIQQLSSSTNVLVIGIASISLLVGGIGVMNIMLVSVTERTREIGLKKALGAKKKRIRRQFLTEAIILSGIGGLLGVLVGIIMSKIIAYVAQTPTAISVPSIIISVAFSMVIGIVFGMAPSVKASNMNPIEALRFE